MTDQNKDIDPSTVAALSTLLSNTVPGVKTFALRDSLLVSTKASLNYLLSKKDLAIRLMDELTLTQGELEYCSVMRMTDSPGAYAVVDNNNTLTVCPNICCLMAHLISRFHDTETKGE